MFRVFSSYPLLRCIPRTITKSRSVSVTPVTGRYYDQEQDMRSGNFLFSPNKSFLKLKNSNSILNSNSNSNNESNSADVFSDLEDEKINEQIIEICKGLETREIRQKKLYSEYMDNVKFTTSGLICVKDLAKKYDLKPVNVLTSLYWRGLELNGYKSANPFNLPLTKIVVKEKYDPTKFNFDKIYKECEESLKNLCACDGLHRYFIKPHLCVILRRDNDYDFTTISLADINPDVNPNTTEVILTEQKNADKHHHSITLDEIIKISTKYGHYINKVGDIYIGNSFDGSHVYDMKDFDNHHGVNALNSALLWSIDTRHNATGDESIRHQKTADTIKKIANELSENNLELEKKLYTDFINLSTHESSDSVVKVGKLMDLYEISSEELLYVMFKYNRPFGMGFIPFAENIDKANTFTLDDARGVLKSQDYYVDYLLGKPIKNSFRKNKGEKQQIYVKKYNDRTADGHFYKCFMMLMAYKHKHSNAQITN